MNTVNENQYRGDTDNTSSPTSTTSETENVPSPTSTTGNTALVDSMYLSESDIAQDYEPMYSVIDDFTDHSSAQATRRTIVQAVKTSVDCDIVISPNIAYGITESGEQLDSNGLQDDYDYLEIITDDSL